MRQAKSESSRMRTSAVVDSIDSGSGGLPGPDPIEGSTGGEIVELKLERLAARSERKFTLRVPLR